MDCHQRAPCEPFSDTVPIRRFEPDSRGLGVGCAESDSYDRCEVGEQLQLGGCS